MSLFGERAMTQAIKRAGAMGIAMVFAMGLVTHANGMTCDRNIDASLTKAVAATVAAVAGNRPDALLAQISHDGVAFGTDGPLMSFVALQGQFSAKTGRFCDLFDCGARPAPWKRLFVMGKIDRQVDAAHGLASVFINANNDELDLSYKYTAQCKWEITGIGVP